MKLIIRKGGNMTEKEIKLYKARGKIDILQKLICTLNNSHAEAMKTKELVCTLMGVFDFVSEEIEKLEKELRKEQEEEG